MALYSTLRSAREELANIATRLDPSLLDGAAAEAIVREAAAIENIAATVKALAAKRAADCGRWRRDGERSPAHALAKQMGSSIPKAREALETAERLAALPQLDTAVRRGELSVAQAAPIADAASKAPDAEQRLIDRAKRASLGELIDECARTKAAALPDDDARHAAVHAARAVRRRRCPDGGAELRYTSTTEEVAEVFAVVQGFANVAFAKARADGRREPEEAYLADGLLAACRAAAAGSPEEAGDSDGEGQGQRRRRPRRRPTPTKVIVRIDWDALIRGWPIRGEVSEIAGLGPVPVSTVQRMIESGDPFLAAVVTKGQDVANVVHLGRRPVAAQRTALEWLSPTCTTLGCNNSHRLEIDHREDWADTKVTLLRWLERHCSHCHDKKTRLGWELVEGRGKRPLVPPDDPRHPRYRGAEARAG